MYIGNSPVSGPARIQEGSGTGDGTTVAFAMGFVPGSEQEVFVFIDGIKQDTTAYSVVGSNCTFTVAPSSGENLDFIGYAIGKSTVPQDNSIDSSKINTGSIKPIVGWTIAVDTAWKTGTVTVPIDDTIPQNTEGNEFMTVTYTPTDSASLLQIDVEAFMTHTAAGSHLLGLLFKDSDADALHVAYHARNAVASAGLYCTFTYYMTAGTTSAITFKFRGGGSTAGTVGFNGSDTIRRYGGAINSFMKVTEVMQ